MIMRLPYNIDLVAGADPRIFSVRGLIKKICPKRVTPSVPIS